MASGGPGQRAGLLVGDVVLEVNGQNVEEKYVEDVIVLVKEGGDLLSLLVSDKSNYNKWKQSNLPTRNTTEKEVIFKIYLLFIKSFTSSFICQVVLDL